MYVCMNVIFTSCDRRTSNNNRKKQSQDNIRYKAENKKLDCYFYLTNGKDFLWRSVKYSVSWHERPRVLKRTLFPAGDSKLFKACVGAQHTHTHTRTRLTALRPGLPGWAGTRKVNQSVFYWSKRQWEAVASPGPYASLHLVPDR